MVGSANSTRKCAVCWLLGWEHYCIHFVLLPVFSANSTRVVQYIIAKQLRNLTPFLRQSMQFQSC
jgi:hypothetical protein